MSIAGGDPSGQHAGRGSGELVQGGFPVDRALRGERRTWVDLDHVMLGEQAQLLGDRADLVPEGPIDGRQRHVEIDPAPRQHGDAGRTIVERDYQKRSTTEGTSHDEGLGGDLPRRHDQEDFCRSRGGEQTGSRRRIVADVQVRYKGPTRPLGSGTNHGSEGFRGEHDHRGVAQSSRFDLASEVPERHPNRRDLDPDRDLADDLRRAIGVPLDPDHEGRGSLDIARL